MNASDPAQPRPEGVEPLHRRQVLIAGAGLALAALPGAAYAFPPRATAEPAVILVLLRGGADGLSLCIPFADPHLADLRPDLVPPPPGSHEGCLAIDRFFALPRAMEPLLDLVRSDRCAIVHAAGLPGGSRSHSLAQRQTDLGRTEIDSSQPAWLARVVLERRGRALAFTRTAPAALSGLPTSDTRLLGAEPVAGGCLADQLLFAASALRGDDSLQAAVIEHTGYDTHTDQAMPDGPLDQTLRELADSLRALHDRFIAPPGARPVRVLVMTEFGRTVGQNAAQGTDHGAASAIFILGRALPSGPGPVRARWPNLAGLDPADALPITADVREVLAKYTGGAVKTA